MSTWSKSTLILVDVEGEFEPGDRLVHVSRDKNAYPTFEKETVGYVVETAKITSAYDQPRFTVHAGDQIYFDVPDVNRPPEVERYHEAYREAWFADRHQRSFLTRGAHYMTLDDHEIVDQYSYDQEDPPKDPKKEQVDQEGAAEDETSKGYAKKQYRIAGMKAYHHYVRKRHPNEVGGKAVNYVDFDYGQARFFLLDTRTERRRHPDATLKDPDPDTRMIGKEQMRAFQDWLMADVRDNRPERLKFVVSGVPFIAEILQEQGDGETSGRVDRSDDKWSGAPFRRQRQEIIELIAEARLQKLVFLVGDMHCAYHASMTIGEGKRWERLRIHELAGGPINQLQHGRKRQFATAVRQMTRFENCPYDIRLHQFHSGANAVMHIDVDSIDVGGDEKVPLIHWRAIRTLTEFDHGPSFDPKVREKGWVVDEAPISGRIVLRAAIEGQSGARQKGAA